MLCHQKRKVRIVCFLLVAFIAVTIDRNDPVGIFIDHDTVWIHAEGAHTILKLLGAVNDLAFI